MFFAYVMSFLHKNVILLLTMYLTIDNKIQFTTLKKGFPIHNMNLDSIFTHSMIKNTSVTYKITEALELGIFKHNPALYFVKLPTRVE